jgi:hypothetical protein
MAPASMMRAGQINTQIRRNYDAERRLREPAAAAGLAAMEPAGRWRDKPSAQLIGRRRRHTRPGRSMSSARGNNRLRLQFAPRAGVSSNALRSASNESPGPPAFFAAGRHACGSRWARFDLLFASSGPSSGGRPAGGCPTGAAAAATTTATTTPRQSRPGRAAGRVPPHQKATIDNERWAPFSAHLSRRAINYPPAPMPVRPRAPSCSRLSKPIITHTRAGERAGIPRRHRRRARSHTMNSRPGCDCTAAAASRRAPLGAPRFRPK